MVQTPTKGGQDNLLVDAATLQSMVHKAQIKVDGVKKTVIVVTPDLAQRLLGANENNRPLKDRVVDQYATDMENGNWVMTGQPLIFDENWKLMDGQHRLNASIRSGKPFTTLIVQGPQREIANSVIDVGEKRRVSDFLKYKGEDNAKVLGAALRLVWTFEEGQLASNKRYPSPKEILETLDRNRAITNFMTSTFTKSVKGMPGSLVAALRYLFGMHDDKKAEKFFEMLATGVGLTIDHPVRTLREKLLGAQGKQRIGQYECAALTIKAWNAYITGEDLGMLRFRTGKNGEKFPQIVGLQVPVEDAQLKLIPKDKKS